MVLEGLLRVYKKQRPNDRRNKSLNFSFDVRSIGESYENAESEKNNIYFKDWFGEIERESDKNEGKRRDNVYLQALLSELLGATKRLLCFEFGEICFGCQHMTLLCFLYVFNYELGYIFCLP